MSSKKERWYHRHAKLATIAVIAKLGTRPLLCRENPGRFKKEEQKKVASPISQYILCQETHNREVSCAM
jgi:hypothetical protein